MKKYEKTGFIPDILVGNRQPHYGDFTEVGDYHQMQDQLAKVDQAFAVLPADTRSKFNNDPAQLIEFLADPNNKDVVIPGLEPEPEAPNTPAASAPAQPVTAA